MIIEETRRVCYRGEYRTDSTLVNTFSLWNVTDSVTTFSDFLSPSTGETASIDLTKFYTTPGFYKLAYDFSDARANAGVNNFVLKIETVPEPTTTIGLLALGIGAVTLKRKGKFSLGVLSKSVS